MSQSPPTPANPVQSINTTPTQCPIAFYGRGDGTADSPLQDWFTLSAIASAAIGINSEKALRSRIARRALCDDPTIVWRPSGLHLRAVKQRCGVNGRAKHLVLLSREGIAQVVPELDLALLPAPTVQPCVDEAHGGGGASDVTPLARLTGKRPSSNSLNDHGEGSSSSNTVTEGRAQPKKPRRAPIKPADKRKHVFNAPRANSAISDDDSFDTPVSWQGMWNRHREEMIAAARAATAANSTDVAGTAANDNDNAWFPPLPPGPPPPLPPLPLGPPPSSETRDTIDSDSVQVSAPTSAFTRVVPASVQPRIGATQSQVQAQSQTLLRVHQQSHSSLQQSSQAQQSKSGAMEVHASTRHQPPPQLHDCNETRSHEQLSHDQQSSSQVGQPEPTAMEVPASMPHQQSSESFDEAQVESSHQLPQANEMQIEQPQMQSTLSPPHDAHESPPTHASQSPPSSSKSTAPLTLQWKEDALIALSRVYTPKAKQNNVQRVARALVRTGKAGKRSGTLNTRCTNADLVALRVFHEIDAPVEGMKSTVMRAQIQQQSDAVWRREAKKIKFRGLD